MLLLEVLVGELLAVDGLATGAVAAGEVTALEHELGDDAVESGALVAEALLAGAESSEVLGRLGDNVVVEKEVDAAGLLCRVVSFVFWRYSCGAAGWAGTKSEDGEDETRGGGVNGDGRQ